MRSPITGLVTQFQSLTIEEQKVFLDLVDPQPEPEPQTKQTRKKRGRSPRAQSLSNAITSSRAAKDDGNASADALNFAGGDEGPKCGICGNAGDFQDHFKPSPNFHEFEAPKSKKAAK